MNNRRGFLKLLGAAVGAAAVPGILTYAEPLLAIPIEGREWVEDRGDFYVVRVPDFKTFAREVLDKPTIFLLGQQAILTNVLVSGFANLSAPRAGVIRDCTFDAREVASLQPRTVLTIGAATTQLSMIGCNLLGASKGCAIEMGALSA